MNQREMQRRANFRLQALTGFVELCFLTLRDEQGKTQTEIAELTTLSKSTVNKMANGHFSTRMAVETLQKMTEAAGLTMKPLTAAEAAAIAKIAPARRLVKRKQPAAFNRRTSRV